MTLLEMSVLYDNSAALLRCRIRELEATIQTEADPEDARRLRQRIAELVPLLREARELAVLTAHYYDVGGHKYEKHTL